MPDPVSNLTVELFTSTTPDVLVSWINPANSVWDNVTISCEPACSPTVVDNPGTNATISGLKPGQTYYFFAVVASEDAYSVTVNSSDPLPIGMLNLVRQARSS